MISKADLKKDKQDILNLWAKNFHDVPIERYDWIYENNPAGQASCWLAKKGEEAVGSTALFPRRLFINGQGVQGGIAGDFSVVREHRGFRIAFLLQKEALLNYANEGFDILYGLPNKQSEGILKRSGYSVIGDVISLTRPLRSQYYLKRVLKHPVITKLASKPVDLFMRISSRESFYIRPAGHSCEVSTQFDSRFDLLWKRALPQFTVIGNRSASYLNWRFVRSPHKSYSIFSVKQMSTDELLGYIVFFSAQNRMNIADILYSGIDALDVLLSEFLIYSRREGLDSVSISLAGSNDLLDKLREYGFSLRDREGKFLLFSHPDSPSYRQTMEIKNWYLLAGDNDI